MIQKRMPMTKGRNHAFQIEMICRTQTSAGTIKILNQNGIKIILTSTTKMVITEETCKIVI